MEKEIPTLAFAADKYVPTPAILEQMSIIICNNIRRIEDGEPFGIRVVIG